MNKTDKKYKLNSPIYMNELTRGMDRNEYSDAIFKNIGSKA